MEKMHPIDLQEKLLPRYIAVEKNAFKFQLF